MKRKFFLTAALIGLTLLLGGCGWYEDISLSIAKSQINEAISQDSRQYKAAMGNELTKCTEVKVLRKISFGQWRARAYFDNGAEMDWIIDNKIVFQSCRPDNGSIRKGK